MYNRRKLIGFLNKLLKDRRRGYELFRFGVVGAIATVTHYGLYLILLPYLKINIAYSLGYIISFVLNFQLSNYFTFKTRPSLLKGVGFGASHALNYALHILLLNVFLWLGVSQQLAPVPVFAIVIPVNFLLVRYVLKSDRLK